MANLLVPNAGIIVLDTNYFFWNSPVCIRKAVLYPNAISDVATIETYRSSDTARATMTGKTVAVATNNTITSTGNFEATELVNGDIIVITQTDVGGDVNTGTFLASRTDDNTAVCYGHNTITPLTNDASGVYSWKTVDGYVVIPLRCSEDSLLTTELDFGEKGIWLQNFGLTQLTSNAKVYLYSR